MERRELLLGAVGLTAALAGCSASTGQGGQTATTRNAATDDTDTPDSTAKDSGMREFPDTEKLLKRHYDALRDVTFVSAERRVDSSPDGEKTLFDRTIRSGRAGTLMTGPDVADDYQTREGTTERVWFTENARMTVSTHRFDPDGVTPPYISRQTVRSLFEIVTMERVETPGDGGQAAVFEASGLTETVKNRDIDFSTLDVKVAVSGAGYIESLNAELTFTQSGDATETVVYEYRMSDVGGVTVSEPDFVGDLPRVEGHLPDDRSTLRLQHSGGRAVSSGTELTVQDRKRVSDPITLPAEFAPGDEAHVYWESAEQAGVSVGEEPAEVARKIALPSDDSDRPVYVEGEVFEVIIRG